MQWERTRVQISQSTDEIVATPRDRSVEPLEAPDDTVHLTAELAAAISQDEGPAPSAHEDPAWSLLIARSQAAADIPPTPRPGRDRHSQEPPAAQTTAGEDHDSTPLASVGHMDTLDDWHSHEASPPSRFHPMTTLSPWA